MSDVEDRLRSDGAAWREQVDAARPELAGRPARRPRAYVGGFIAAAAVIAMAVMVLALRHPSSTGGRAAAGEPATAGVSSAPAAPSGRSGTASSGVSAPPRRQVPQQAMCPTSGNAHTMAGSGFAVSFAQGYRGEPTVQAAAAKYPPHNARWTVAAQDPREALVLFRAHYLHLVRMPGGGWAVDSGGVCGGVNATVAK